MNSCGADRIVFGFDFVPKCGASKAGATFTVPVVNRSPCLAS